MTDDRLPLRIDSTKKQLGSGFPFFPDPNGLLTLKRLELNRPKVFFELWQL
ncbi:hypothetical protein [Limnospira platensis]|uniref:hypothetical protein n=1 Tax=Limnospira platensis TaxID=118562 RepID=UPI0002D29BAC|nr:hypothetical protein AP9108_18555 [Arthrospira sp. PCC 9108]